jgi:acyl-CoA synthetase (AMP-forming)/AMP-acid ligase II
MAILTGGSVVQLPKFDPVAVLEAIQRHRPTVWFAIPTMLQRVVASHSIDSYDLVELRVDLVGRPCAEACGGRAALKVPLTWASVMA